MARLKFKETEGQFKTALGMHAKDGEYVEFNHECDCTGAVSKNYVQKKLEIFICTLDY